MEVKVLLDEGVEPFEKATEGSSGFDLRAKDDCIIQPGTVAHIQTGVRLEVPMGYEVQVRGRSGLSKKGIMLANGIGTIDSDYRGDVGVLLFNSTKENFEVSKGDRIAQMVVIQLPDVTLDFSGNLGKTDRGEGGFGSTGK